MERRLFLGASMGAAAAVEKPIGIGFLGSSHSHGQAKVDVVRANPAYRLIGVSDQGAKREDLLRDPAVEVIAVESAVRDHARDAMDALRAGKHVHVEKMPADNLKDFAAIVDLARKKQRLVQVGYMWRYHPGIGAALEAARNGWLGQVYMVRGCIGNTLAADRRPEWAEFRGGTMFELGCHVIDPVVRMLGRPVGVTPFLNKHGKFADSLHDNNVAVLQYASAMAVVYGSNLQHNSGKYRAFEVQGTNGCVIVNPIEPPAVVVDLAKAAGPYKAGMQTVTMPPYKRYVDDFVELAAAVRGTGKLRVGLDEDLLVQEVVLRCSGML